MNAGFHGKIRTMHSTPLTAIPTPEEAARWTAEQVVELAGEHLVLGRQFEAIKREVQTLNHQLDWFRRQIFGQKSEKRLLEANPQQMNLADLPVPESSPPLPGKEVAAHSRRPQTTDYDGGTAHASQIVAVGMRDFFDQSKHVKALELSRHS